MDKINPHHVKPLQDIAAYTLQLEQTPLEEFRTSAKARATFIKTLKAAATDFGWIVDEIRMSQDSLAEIKHMKLDAEKYSPQYEEFIVLGKAALARFAACFPAIKDIVLDGTHEEIDELERKFVVLCEAEELEEALEADLTPRPDPWQ
jgi:hypothetical protein